MTPKTLKEWLHHADDEILARFIINHQNLIAQLMQAWQRQLNKEQAAHNLPVAATPPPKPLRVSRLTPPSRLPPWRAICCPPLNT